MSNAYVSRIHKELLQLPSKKTAKVQVGTELKQTFLPRRYPCGQCVYRRCWTSLVVRETNTNQNRSEIVFLLYSCFSPNENKFCPFTLNTW